MKINARFLDKVRMHYHNDICKVTNLSIIEEGDDKKVRMANLAIVGSFSVNGVAGSAYKNIGRKNICRFL